MVGTSGGEHTLLDALPDGVVVADATGAVVVINEAAAQLLGTGDGVGKHLADVVALQDNAGNDWYTCAAPYDGLSTRTALTEQSWFLSDGTELLRHRPDPPVLAAGPGRAGGGLAALRPRPGPARP